MFTIFNSPPTKVHRRRLGRAYCPSVHFGASMQGMQGSSWPSDAESVQLQLDTASRSSSGGTSLYPSAKIFVSITQAYPSPSCATSSNSRTDSSTSRVTPSSFHKIRPADNKRQDRSLHRLFISTGSGRATGPAAHWHSLPPTLGPCCTMYEYSLVQRLSHKMEQSVTDKGRRRRILLSRTRRDGAEP